MEGNVFIEFEIIKNSDLQELKTELDKLIGAGHKIYTWSKKITPLEMRRYCVINGINRNKNELNEHKKVLELREKRKTYKEIAEELNLKEDKVSYYINTQMFDKWVIDDWIVDYYKKDSSVYSKVDFVVDSDPKLVERFEKSGIKGNVLTKL